MGGGPKKYPAAIVAFCSGAWENWQRENREQEIIRRERQRLREIGIGTPTRRDGTCPVCHAIHIPGHRYDCYGKLAARWAKGKNI